MVWVALGPQKQVKRRIQKGKWKLDYTGAYSVEIVANSSVVS